MDICFIFGGSILFPLAIGLMRALSRMGRTVSKPANVRPLPVIRYYLPEGLTQEQKCILMSLREKYERGDFLPAMHEVEE